MDYGNAIATVSALIAIPGCIVSTKAILCWLRERKDKDAAMARPAPALRPISQLIEAAIQFVLFQILVLAAGLQAFMVLLILQAPAGATAAWQKVLVFCLALFATVCAASKGLGAYALLVTVRESTEEDHSSNRERTQITNADKKQF